MSIFKKRNKKKQPFPITKNPQYIQNFNAPVGAVLNGEHSYATINQSIPNDNILLPLESHRGSEKIIESTKLIVSRFLSIYENHNIKANQIPKFASKFSLKLSDFINYDTVLEILNEDLIFWTCNKFNVERSWVEGESDFMEDTASRIYEYFNCYKSLPLIMDLLKSYEDVPCRNVCLYAIKNGVLTRDTTNKSTVVLIFQEKIGEINHRSIYRYKPITTRWQWNYLKMRYQAKAIFMLCKRYGIEMRGFDLTDSVIDKLCSGKIFPGTVIKNCSQRSWYPEDYISATNKNYLVKEAEELKEVLSSLKDDGYFKIVQAIENI